MSETNTGTAGQDRRVSVGEVVEVVLPAREVTWRLRVAEHVRPVRVLERGAQILNDDGTPLSVTVSFTEAGLMLRGNEVWAAPVPDMLWCVRRDGTRVSPDYMATQNAASTWLMRHQAHSTDYACQHNGYSIEQVSAADREREAATTPAPDTTPGGGSGGDGERGGGSGFFLAEFGGYPTGTRHRAGGRRR